MTSVVRRLGDRELSITIERHLDREAKASAQRPGRPYRRLMLVSGRYALAEPKILKVGQQTVLVRSAESVLGLYEAWYEFDTDRPADWLVLVTPLDDDEIGSDLLMRAIQRGTLTVLRRDTVLDLFGARELDRRVDGADSWLVDALIEAMPPSGWERTGGAVLDYDTVLRQLARARLGLSSDVIDAEELLTWSLDNNAVADFLALSAEEREGLEKWLCDTVGATAEVLLTLVRAGRGSDAAAIGLLGTVLWSGDPSDASVARAAGRAEALFHHGSSRQQTPAPDELAAFSAAVAGALLRWIGESSRPDAEAMRQRVKETLARADEVSSQLRAEDLAPRNEFLPTGFESRVQRLAAALVAGFASGSARDAQDALRAVEEHHYAQFVPNRLAPAQAAVRLLRWCLLGEDLPDSVATGVFGHLRDWGWVDRAAIVVEAGDPVPNAMVADAYRLVFEQVSSRRAEIDRAFASRLAAWSSVSAPGTILMTVEQVLDRVVAPLASMPNDIRASAPLVLVLDGMSSAVAVELGEQVRAQGWTEVTTGGHGATRQAALAMLPSTTRVSRASLLTGTAAIGGQDTEKDGFRQFWNWKGRSAQLFHLGDISGAAGSRLGAGLTQALAEPATVVGVVLNTIDDMLDKGRPGVRTGWAVHDITHLDILMDAARSYGRPIVLVSDHGHVLEHGTRLRSMPGAVSARWRPAADTEPGEGEIEIEGPRVLEGGGHIIAPWRVDVRYAPKKAGYHGGLSLAEMTVPVLLFTTEPDVLPDGWRTLAREDTTPAWWDSTAGGDTGTTSLSTREPAAAAGLLFAAAETPTRTARRRPDNHPAPALFDVRSEQPATVHAEPVTIQATAPAKAAASSGATLGRTVVKSVIYRKQLTTVRRKPTDEQVAALIDALDAAGGTLSSTKAIEVMGTSVARLEGTFATLQRILNVETYPVLGLTDGGRTARLDLRMLREQFKI